MTNPLWHQEWWSSAKIENKVEKVMNSWNHLKIKKIKEYHLQSLKRIRKKKKKINLSLFLLQKDLIFVIEPMRRKKTNMHLQLQKRKRLSRRKNNTNQIWILRLMMTISLLRFAKIYLLIIRQNKPQSLQLISG